MAKPRRQRLELAAMLALAGWISAVLPAAAQGTAPGPTGQGLFADVSNCLLKPKRVVQLGSPVFGVLAKVFVDRADRITAGQVLAKLDTTVEEAQVAADRFRAENTTQVEAARTDLAWNMRELDRRQKLAGNMFSKANDIDDIQTKVEQDKIAIRKAEADIQSARLEAARSSAQLELKILKSPVSGVVMEVKLNPGEFIYEQTPIMTLAEIDPLTVDLVLPAADFRLVRLGATGEVHLLPPVDTTFPARIDAVDPVIDAASDTFRVRLVLPNPGNAIPAGIRCSVHLPDVTHGE